MTRRQAPDCACLDGSIFDAVESMTKAEKLLAHEPIKPVYIGMFLNMLVTALLAKGQGRRADR